ncbi:OsmC family peroxiredoxin [Parahaliea maris]|uniref:OsmC family peroxiredoxin n=1 Tax=Parahaliea maris TaxID=2716870 RepID=A0A5C9A1X7_9GAMM|nr:OsmC family protein [Parahaliea maris]TXS94004.1 OsmC family peroxiredoxin [Parahaliea maris]
MQELPHHYRVTARAGDSGNVVLCSEGLDDMATAPPAEFGGPGDLWSPESLLVGAVADCFVLTFRAVARASRLDWVSLDCAAEGVLERVDRVTRFTRVELVVSLRIPQGGPVEQAERLLHKAEAGCLITNSMTCEVALACTVEESD